MCEEIQELAMSASVTAVVLEHLLRLDDQILLVDVNQFAAMVQAIIHLDLRFVVA